MIYFNSCIYTHNDQGRIACKIKEGQKIKAFNEKLQPVHRHIISSSKAPRRTPYRLLTQSLLYYIDTYLSSVFMVRKPDKRIVIKRLGEVRDEEEFVLFFNGKFFYERPFSLTRDTAVSRFYNIKLGKPALVPVDHFIMKIE